MEGPQNGHVAHELPGIPELLSRINKRMRRESPPDAATDEQQREEIRMQ